MKKNAPMAQTICGTPLYMAPELINKSTQADTYDAYQSDIWSLGHIFFELLFGYAAYSLVPNLETLRDVVQNKLVIPEHELDEPLSPDCKALLQQMLEISPTRRLELRDIANHSCLAKLPPGPGSEQKKIHASPTANLVESKESKSSRNAGSSSNEKSPRKKPKLRIHVVPSHTEQDVKLNEYALTAFPEEFSSVSQADEAISAGLVLVNGESVEASSLINVNEGDVVSLDLVALQSSIIEE